MPSSKFTSNYAAIGFVIAITARVTAAGGNSGTGEVVVLSVIVLPSNPQRTTRT